MKTYLLDYTELSKNTWTREIEADSLEEARAIMLDEIQGEEPEIYDVYDSRWEDGSL